jgi:L-ascorbate metabolism protein UlaG (beta-lactamase superfamily)
MEMNFNWIGGATFILTIGNLTIGVDPVLCKKGVVQDFFWFKSKRIEEPIYTDSAFDNVDLWIITHAHEDHLDDIGMSKISEESKVVCNRIALKILNKKGIQDLTSLKWYQSNTFIIKDFELRVEAIPAIHGVNPISALIAGNVNGYFLTIRKGNDSKRVYITGDTVYKKRIRKSIANRKIDLMIPNMGAAKSDSWIMTLTLNAHMLQRLITDLNPRNVVPVHYGTFEHYNEPIESILSLDDSRIKIVNVGDKITIE